MFRRSLTPRLIVCASAFLQLRSLVLLRLRSMTLSFFALDDRSQSVMIILFNHVFMLAILSLIVFFFIPVVLLLILFRLPTGTAQYAHPIPPRVVVRNRHVSRRLRRFRTLISQSRSPRNKRFCEKLRRYFCDEIRKVFCADAISEFLRNARKTPTKDGQFDVGLRSWISDLLDVKLRSGQLTSKRNSNSALRNASVPACAPWWPPAVAG